MRITQKLCMDLARAGCKPIVAAVQGEGNTRVLEIDLFDKGVAWEIPDGATAAVAFRKPDGTKGLYDTLTDGSTKAVTISGSTATAILAPQVLTCAGTVLASVVFYDAEMDTLATFPFKITVEANPAAGEQISNNYYYLQNMEQVNAAYANMLTRLEKMKIEAETAVPAEAAQMKALTIGGETFEVVDERARKDVGSLTLGVHTDGLVYVFLNGNPIGDGMDISGGSIVTYGKIVVSLEELAMSEGGSATVDITLSRAPSEAQPVYLAVTDNTLLSVEPATLTFTPDNWNVPQTVTVTALQDEDMYDEESAVSLTTKTSEKIILVTVSDDDRVELATDGLTLNYNLRDGNLTDSVGGVVATNGGTVVDGGVQMDSQSTKFQFVYPVQNTNFPNGVTVEYAITNIADLQGAGSGWGNGYAYKGQVVDLTSKWLGYYGGFAYSVSGSTIQPDTITSATVTMNDIDWNTEHHLCAVYNTDGSVVHYLDGVAVATRDAVEGFENYLASGKITFKIPYGAGGGSSYPAILHEFRIYERALAAGEVLGNYKCTVANQNAVNF